MKLHGSSSSAAAALTLGLLMATPMVHGAALDGKSNLVCATRTVVACNQEYGCMDGTAQAFELPDFMYVDFKARIVHARSADAKERVESPIRSLDIEDVSILVQGLEDHQAWTLAVTRATGQMTTTVTGSAVDYMIFGACTAI